MTGRQVVWPDTEGHLPWEDGYAYPPEVQPIRRLPQED